MMMNKKGFTLAEVLVGVALLSIVGMVAAAFFVFTNKTKTEIVNDLEDKTDTIIAERILLRDLKYSEPSFNNVAITDDAGRVFFDYDAERSQKAIDSLPRKITLTADNKKEFTFMIVNDKLGATMMYTPRLAYKIPYVPKDPNVAAPLNFVSLNQGNTVTQANSRFWQPGVVLMLDTPAMVREMTAFGPNYSRPARSPIFVGSVQAVGETKLAALSIPGLLNRSNPMYPNETIDSEDSFLRDIPPMGGAAPLVRLKAVGVIKYYISQDPVTKKVNLLRSLFDGRTFPAGQLIASDVQRVEFSRKDPHDSLVYFNIVRSKGK